MVLLCCYLLLVIPDHHPPLPGPGDHPQVPSPLLLHGHAHIARHLAGLGAPGQYLSRGKVRLLIQGAEENSPVEAAHCRPPSRVSPSLS